MKKLLKNKGVITALIGFIVLSVVVCFQYVEARIENNDNVQTMAETVDNVATHLVVAAETTSTSTIAVDRSDITNFPHLFVGAYGIEVSQFIINWTADGLATTTGKLGLIASTTSAGNLADVYWFEEFSFASADTSGSNYSGRQQKIINYSPSVLKLAMTSGTPSGFLTNDSSLSTGDFATTSPLLSPNGYIAPNVGDLVLRIYDQNGTATTTLTTIYRTR